MIYGHICRNSKRAAREELYESPDKVFCLECGEITELHICDFGFGDDFGGVSDYEVVTKCCEGGSDTWVKAECEVCGTDGEPEIMKDEEGKIIRGEDGLAKRHPAKKLVKAPKGWDERLVCEVCKAKIEKEIEEEAA